ncbi:MAG: YraN family protein [Flavobacteriaceae bacterium]|nr:YraN family protein [Flavobacteriaceae bacterium]
MAQHNDLGKIGEQIAVDFLTQKGYEIKARNWRFKKAEIDIIAKLGNVLIAVEVKTRSTGDFGDPQEFLKPKQKKLLVTAMHEYVVTKDLDIEVRFDVIAIIKNEQETSIEHLEDAFFHF